MIYENTVSLSKVLDRSETALHDSLWDSKMQGSNSPNTVVFFTRDDVMSHLRFMIHDFSRDMLSSLDSGDMETFNITSEAIGEISGYMLLIHESTASSFYIESE